jgi:hypothetical protein
MAKFAQSGVLLSCVASVLLFSAPAAAGTIISFDFGANVDNRPNNQVVLTNFSQVDFDGNGSGDYWNQMGRAPGGVLYGGVHDIAGNLVSGAWFTLYSVRDYNPNDAFAPTATQWGNALGIPNGVLPSLYFDYPEGTLMSFAFGGLQPQSRWTVEVFSVLNNPNTISLDLNGHLVEGHERQTFFSTFDPLDARVLFPTVQASSSGELRLAVTQTSTEWWPAIQAVRLQAQPIPEPNSIFIWLVVGSGGFACMYRRRDLLHWNRSRRRS